MTEIFYSVHIGTRSARQVDFRTEKVGASTGRLGGKFRFK